MDTPKLIVLSIGSVKSVEIGKFVQEADLTAWLAQEVKCPSCDRGRIDGWYTCPICGEPNLGAIEPVAGTGHLTLGALIQKLEAKP